MGRITGKQKWKCKACGAVSLEGELLTAPSPFDTNDTLSGCPECKQCSEGFDLLCDDPGCSAIAGCGWPTGDNLDEWGGYRNTCGKHWPPNTINQSPNAE